MRFLKLASAKNPDNDYILLNGGYFDEDGVRIKTLKETNGLNPYKDSKGKDRYVFEKFNGFLCTKLQPLGISRKLDFLAIENRQVLVGNRFDFKKYNLTIEILSNYEEYENKYKELRLFIERNKNNGFRLYYSPFIGMDIKYCLCEFESSNKGEKTQPVTLTFVQTSLWLGSLQTKLTSQVNQSGNIFAFYKDNEIDNSYSTSFSKDDKTNEYCVSLYNGIQSQADISNGGYYEIPLTIKINGPCVNPIVYLFAKNGKSPIRKTQILANVDYGYYIEIKAGILDSGVWYVNEATGKKEDYSGLINNSFGSPYFYIGNGNYYIKVEDAGQNIIETSVSYQEEYSE